jgi:hypothetical protein
VFFDPYWVWPSGIGQAPDAQAPSLAGDEHPSGGLQLDFEPRRALVYVDGSHVGRVYDFSGYYRHLELPAGPHRVELVTPGYDPLFLDVVVAPGRTTTYRGWLNRR